MEKDVLLGVGHMDMIWSKAVLCCVEGKGLLIIETAKVRNLGLNVNHVVGLGFLLGLLAFRFGPSSLSLLSVSLLFSERAGREERARRQTLNPTCLFLCENNANVEIHVVYEFFAFIRNLKVERPRLCKSYI